MPGPVALERMRAIDAAWNARDWDAYAGYLDDALVAYASGEADAHGKAEHVAGATRFCAAFPDARVHTEPYVALFANEDGTRTCSVARMTGTAGGRVELPGGPLRISGRRGYEITFAAICDWRDGRIVGQRQYVDLELMLRQLRGESDLPQRKPTS